MKVKSFMQSFKSTLDFDSGKVGPTNRTKLKFRYATHLLCRGWLCRVTKWQMFATGIFKTIYVIFG